METIGWPELLVIGIVFVVLFGSKKIPDVGKGIGEGIKNFKAALRGDPDPVKEPEKTEEPVEKV